MHRAAAMALAFTLLVSPFLINCNRNKNSAGQTGNTQQSAAQPIGIDDLVAPIALYPDQLLGQMLAVSTNPQEVLDVGNWLLQNQNLQGDALTSAAKQAGFSPSAQYLAAFPQVVDQMCQQMDWTRQLGEAFKDNQKGVLDAIQRKRTQAQQMGNLASSPQMTVDTKTDQGQQVTEIKTMDEISFESLRHRQFVGALLALFSAVSLALALIGLYGVISYSVAQRRWEIGLRMALGASRIRVISLFLVEGLRVTAIGIACGVVGAVVAIRLLMNAFFGIARLPVLDVFAAAALLFIAAVFAVLGPAVRASRIDPAVGLREL